MSLLDIAPSRSKAEILRHSAWTDEIIGLPIWCVHKKHVEKLHARSTLDSVSSATLEAEAGSGAEWNLLNGHFDLGRVGINALRDDAIGHFA